MRNLITFARIVLRQLGEEIESIRKLPQEVGALRVRYRQLKEELDVHKAELGCVAHTATMWRVVNEAQEMCPDCGMQWTKGGVEQHYDYQEVRCPRLKK